MIPANNKYPVFEANQVLSAQHLNTMLGFLDEQNRITRTVLQGIGIVCGLEVSVEGSADKPLLRITRGAGVTSEGYAAIVGEQDFTADRTRPFTTKLLPEPDALAYDAVELLDAGHEEYADGTALTRKLLRNTSVLFFVEVFDNDQKICTASSCDDLGRHKHLRFRKLLVTDADLVRLRAEIDKHLPLSDAAADLRPNIGARLGLKDIRLPRLDVPASNLIDTQSLFAAYERLFFPSDPVWAKTGLPVKGQRKTKILIKRTASLFARIGSAIDDCLGAFSPPLAKDDTKPAFEKRLNDIAARFVKEASGAGVINAQYYYDFLGDLILAYDEFRRKALEFASLCNPPQQLFPRHLELCRLAGESPSVERAGYRNHFRPAPSGVCSSRREELLMLFRRIVLLVDNFLVPETKEAGNIRITPSRTGRAQLSERAIPYYYGAQKELQESWDYRRSSTGRSSDIPGYHLTGVEEFRYDLEQSDFFRIEGHLGTDWRQALEVLLGKVRDFRLPFDVVALNAHHATVVADTLKEPLRPSCQSGDLQVIYNAWAKELECLMRDKIGAISDFKVHPSKELVKVAVESSLPISRKTLASKISIVDAIPVSKNSFGNILVNVLNETRGSSTLRMKESFVKTLEKEVPEVGSLNMTDYKLLVGQRLDTVAAMIDFSDVIPDKAEELDYEKVEQKYAALAEIAGKYRKELEDFTASGNNPVMTAEERDATLKVLRELLGNCLMPRIKELGAELTKRKAQIDEQTYFCRYLRKHPSMTHKAGVPAGGTFILVYQEPPATATAIDTAGGTTYKVPERVVIADFFIPYRCVPECPPVQFVLPAARPIFGMKAECADAAGIARVALEFTYRTPPCLVWIDGKEYLPLVDDTIELTVGRHTVTVMDALGGESVPQPIEIFRRLSAQADKPVCDDENQTYTVTIRVSDARLPITLDGHETASTDVGNGVRTIVAGPYESGSSVTVAIGDASGCPGVELNLSHTCCKLPAKGVTRTSGHLFWLPEPPTGSKFGRASAKAVSFSFEYPAAGRTVDLTAKVDELVKTSATAIGGDVVSAARKWIADINRLVEESCGDKAIVLSYQSPSSPGFFGTLTIEHYEGLAFDINIVSTYGIGRQALQTLDIGYTPLASAVPKTLPPVLKEQLRQIVVPAFDPVRSFRCEPERKPEPLCQAADLKIDSITVGVAGKALSFDFTSSGSVAPACCLWEVLNVTPMLSNEHPFSYTPATMPTAVKLRLSLFTAAGCRITKEFTRILKLPA